VSFIRYSVFGLSAFILSLAIVPSFVPSASEVIATGCTVFSNDLCFLAALLNWVVIASAVVALLHWNGTKRTESVFFQKSFSLFVPFNYRQQH
jgi:hypothetical protein